ncbi:MAG: SDR family NAD(P)-dependent oxidoreductase [Clostridiales bacterium]|nr:SDR family NAD(P)-dependent oxidoreductase [Clostridiales bacterium]
MKKIAIVTGASSGIGRSIIDLIYDSYDEIWAVARRRERLEEIAGKYPGKVKAVVADLGRPGYCEEMEKLLKESISADSGLMLLVNSAGIGYRRDLADMDPGQIDSTIEVDIKSLTLITKAVLPYMREGSGIINIASSAGYLPQPGFAVYSAAKAYVINFSRALRTELKSRKITVTCVCPGPVDTEFQGIATGTPEITGWRRHFTCSPESVAKGAVKAFRHKRGLYNHKLPQKFLHVVSKTVPVGLILKMYGGIEK